MLSPVFLKPWHDPPVKCATTLTADQQPTSPKSEPFLVGAQEILLRGPTHKAVRNVGKYDSEKLDIAVQIRKLSSGLISIRTIAMKTDE
jgi:hypothetical protein